MKCLGSRPIKRYLNFVDNRQMFLESHGKPLSVFTFTFSLSAVCDVINDDDDADDDDDE